jgi:hypothetical protein
VGKRRNPVGMSGWQYSMEIFKIKEEARKKNLDRYQMLMPCAKGHLGYRNINSNMCCECTSERTKTAKAKRDLLRGKESISREKSLEAWNNPMRERLMHITLPVEHHEVMRHVAIALEQRGEEVLNYLNLILDLEN